MKNEGLRRLKEAIRRDREVEVDSNGRVREIPDGRNSPQKDERAEQTVRKPTKIAPRTFGAASLALTWAAQLDPKQFVTGSALADALATARHIRVLCPVEDAYGKQFPHQDALGILEAGLLPITRGTFAARGIGTWLGDDGAVDREPMDSFEAFLPRPLRRDERIHISGTIQRLIESTNQQAIATAVDGALLVLWARQPVPTPAGLRADRY